MEVKIGDINLLFETGKIHAIVGPVSAGKSNLLETINKKYINSSISFYNQDVNQYFLFDTVKQELLSSVSEESTENKEKMILDALNKVDMDSTFVNRKINTLSLSEMRRIQLASILLQNKQYILLDDPTLYLDEREKKNLIHLLKPLKKEKNIIIATRDLSFALNLCDDICLFNHKIIYFDQKNEAMKHMELFEKEKLCIPFPIMFSMKVKKEKNISIGYRLDIYDLIKDIYRNVT